jgi:hypothetical protein
MLERPLRYFTLRCYGQRTAGQLGRNFVRDQHLVDESRRALT